MSGFLGIDTSNYTTSCAVYRQGVVLQQKRLLPVPEGQLGLRQSDAVFSHVKSLSQLTKALREQDNLPISAIGVSVSPRDEEGSYMPCFLSGKMAAEVTADILGCSCYHFSHQSGHIAAALYGANRLDLIDKSFVAFHLSGGTTECVWVKNLLTAQIETIAETNDINAGQLVDRVGKLLGIPFPAGKELDLLSQQSTEKYRIKVSMNGVNPCLSGFENKCKLMLEQGAAPCDVARYAIEAILSALILMIENARKATGCDTMVFAGGVMSNSIISKRIKDLYKGIFSPTEFSCDNAAGTAILTALKAGEQVFRKE